MQSRNVLSLIPRAPEATIPRYMVRYDNWDYPSESRDMEADSMTYAELFEQTKRDFTAAVPLIRAEGERHVAKLRARDPAYVQAYVGWREGVTDADIARAIAFVRNVTKAYATHRAPEKVAAVAWKRVVASHKRMFPRAWYQRLGLRSRTRNQSMRAWESREVTAEQSRARDAYVLSRRTRRRR